MNGREMRTLLASGENETVEFKERPNEHFYKTVSAFANTKGGVIILGVDKRSSVIGIESSSRFLEDLTNRIVNKLSIYPEIDTIDTKGKRVIIIKVVRSVYPVSYDGRYYQRVGNTTREIKSEKLQGFLIRNMSWDTIPNNFSLAEIDTESFDRFLRLAVGKKRLTDISLNEPPQLILQKLGLISDGKLTNGTILLFGKSPQKHFINLCVRIGRFKTETTIIDDKWVKGNLFNNLKGH